jgi:HlyD family secretion protein
MAKKKSKKKWIILIIVVLVVALAVVAFISFRNNLNAQSKTKYEITPVQSGTIDVKVKGAGAVEPLVDETIYASFSGAVADVLVEDGDVVSADDVIVTFDSEAIETEMDAIEQQIEDVDRTISTLRSTTSSATIYSPVEGRVKIMYAEKGDNVDVVVAEHGALAVLCPDDLMQVKIPNVDGVAAGDAVVVTIGEKSEGGTVYEIGETEMTIHFEDDKYYPGDSAVVTSEDGTHLGDASVSIANPVYIVAQGGEISSIYEPLGHKVKRMRKLFKRSGEILSADLYAQIELRKELEQDLADLEEDLMEMTVYAGTDGVVSGLALNTDQIVQEGTPLFTIESNKTVKLDVEIDEIDIVNIVLGQEAIVDFDALPDKTYTATVVKINPIGISVNNVTNFTITLEIEQASEIMLGMSADVEIVSQSAKDVLVIPIEAVQVIDGKKYVVLEEDVNEELEYTKATHQIITGITDGVNIEVKEGLSEGDKIAVPMVKEFSAQDFMMSGPPRNNSFDK